MKQRLIYFLKTETVLAVSIVLAIISACMIPPNRQYIEYIDFRVLGILLMLMIIMAGYQKEGVFDEIGSWLLRQSSSIMQLNLVLVFLCFFFGMVITNDVALITFVPFTILVLKKCHRADYILPIIILQTVAANLGSMFTPIGNPQNLYLYNCAGFSLGTFMKIMAPYTIVSAVIIMAATVFMTKSKEKHMDECNQLLPEFKNENKNRSKMHTWVYTILFVMVLLVVLRVVSYEWVLIMVVGAVCFMDRKILYSIDYSLIATFIGFFIFIGNMGHITAVRNLLEMLIQGRVVWMGILTSQIVSNVPATLLLSGFTTDYKQLLIGVNVGGLGTLIASMASLISYKLYVNAYPDKKNTYIGWFTIINIVILMLLILTIAVAIL